MSPVEAPQGPSDEIRRLDLELRNNSLKLRWFDQDAACFAKLPEQDRREFGEALGYFAHLMLESVRRGEAGTVAGAVRTALCGSPPPSGAQS